RLAVPVLLGVTTGLRRGELLGLRWQDVDLDGGKLAVRQSLEQTKAGGLAFKQPKTQKGRRVVTLPPIAVEALRRHRADQARERLLLGPAYEDHGLVLAQADGRPVNPEDVTRAFKRLARKAGVPAALASQAPAHARDAPPRREPSEGCERAPRPRDGRHHTRHLLARVAALA